TYASFDLMEVHAADPTLLPRIFADLRGLVEAGEIQPLPVASLPLAEAETGFRRMARAQHVGKIVFVPPVARSTRGWTVLTGGTGALGLATLRWLLEGGARRVAVWSRRGATAE